MRHRQTSGAGSLGARPGITVFVLTASGLVLAPSLGGSAGPWTGFAMMTAAALIGGGTLWQQRGQLEQRVAELAKRRRADLAQAAQTELRHRAETDRLCAELDHEQQYSTLVQDQLTRARRQLEDERAARRAAERELDALTTGSGTGRYGQSQQFAQATIPQPAKPEPVADEVAPGRPFRPFVEHLASVSEAALAMAPVIEPTPAADAVLDLTAYDETLEFSVRDVRGGVA
jgi:hypothetical protein